MNNINEIKEDICRLRDPQNDGWIDKILIKLDELQSELKTEEDKLKIELADLCLTEEIAFIHLKQGQPIKNRVYELIDKIKGINDGIK